MTNINRKKYLVLILILFLAFSLRLSFFITRTPIIENEGGELATIAENLIEGKGYIGQGLTGKPQLSIPPLYPYSMVLLATLTKSTETAGRTVSFVMGLWLVVILYKLGTYLYTQRVGLIAAAMAALHPVLAIISIQVQTESTYYALVLTGIYFSLKAIELGLLKYFLFASLFYSIAYMTRPEAILIISLTIGYISIVSFILTKNWKSIIVGNISMALLFVVVASPYVFYLHQNTGKFLLEGKTPVNFALGKLLLTGKSELEAAYGVDDDLNEVGVYMGNINKYYNDSQRSAIPDGLIYYLKRTSKVQLKNIYDHMVKMQGIGGPFLLALVFMGLFRTPWDRTRAMKELYLFIILLSITMTLLTVLFFQSRYLYIVIPFFLLWGSKGIEEISCWIRATLNNLTKWSMRAVAIIQNVICMSLVLGILSIAAWQYMLIYHKYDDFQSTKLSCMNTKNAGLWLRTQQPIDKIIMDAGSAVPYYSRAEYIALPSASQETAIKYINMKKPDYIILRGSLMHLRPYYKEWLISGIPDRNATLVYDVGMPIQEKIQIYKWNCRE